MKIAQTAPPPAEAPVASGLATAAPNATRRGGRQKGTPNKATAARRAAMAAGMTAALGGLTAAAIAEMSPLDALRLVLRIGLAAGDIKLTFSAAVALAPYLHARRIPVAPELPQEDLATRARVLHELLVAMDATVGGDTSGGS